MTGSPRAELGAATPSTPTSRGQNLRDLGVLFLRLGATAFGGPAAHIAMFEDEVVRRRRWMSHERFLDMLGATNLIPGPNSTEMAIHVGYDRAGFAGVVVAGVSFILPAACITLVLAWLYVAYGSLPEATAFLYGAKPAIIAVVFQALWRLGRTALRSKRLVLAACVAFLASVCGVDELLVLFGTGLLLTIPATLRRERRSAVLQILVPVGVAGGPAATGAAFTLGALFLFFLKVGAVLFGSGYVLLAFLRADLVERWHWLSSAQLLDAIAVGQVTPGPVFTTATFIGYVLGGGWGALAATIGIFLPAFVFVALTAPFLGRMRESPLAAAFLDGVNVASLALLAFVTIQLLSSAVVDWWTGAIAFGGAVLLVRFGLNSAWLIAGGGALGLLAGLQA